MVIRDDQPDMEATLRLRGSRNRPLRTERIDVGEDRIAWEAVFDDETMLELNRRLYRRSKPLRAALRRRVFEAAVPDINAAGTRSIAELIGDPAAARKRLHAVMDDVLAESTAT